MLRETEEQDEAVDELARVRRRWGWFGGVKAGPAGPQVVQQGETATDDVEVRGVALRTALARRKRSLRLTGIGAGVATSGVAGVLAVATTLGVSTISSPAMWLPFSLFAGGEALVLGFVLRDQAAFQTAVNALASCDDLRAIGPLAEALALGEPSYSLVVSALTRLLLRLTAADAELLNEPQRASLRHALKESSGSLKFWRRNAAFASVLRRALTLLNLGGSTGPADEAGLTEQHATDVEALLKQFQAAVRQRRKNALTIGVASVAGATTALGNIVLQTAMHHPWASPLLAAAIGSVGVTLALTLGGLAKLRAMMTSLAESGDLRVVGPLIEIAAIQDGSANAMAALLLTRLLPRLRASDSALLTGEQRAALGRALTSNGSNADFLIAALKALEQVGDSRAIGAVEGLAAGRGVTADPKRVRAAAQECLPFLLTRYEEERASRSLLRASDGGQTPPDALLRPADGVAPAEESELLRAEGDLCWC